jgi:hypothetical protein
LGRSWSFGHHRCGMKRRGSGRLFTQERVAVSAGLFLDGVLGDKCRKTGWMRAEAAGDPGPWRQQPFWAVADGTRMRGATSCGTMSSNTWRPMMRCWSSTRLASSSRAARLAMMVGNTPARRARSPIARSGVRRLCVAARTRLHRPGAVSAKSLHGQSRANGSGACARRHGLCDETRPSP